MNERMDSAVVGTQSVLRKGCLFNILIVTITVRKLVANNGALHMYGILITSLVPLQGDNQLG